MHIFNEFEIIAQPIGLYIGLTPEPGEPVAKGPQGQRRSGDVAQVAHQVFAIAIGEEKDPKPSGRRESGLAGSKARRDSLSASKRSAIARKAAAARWETKPG